MARVSGKYEYTVNIMPHLKLSSYSVGVSITETSQISHIDVKRLSFRRKEDSKEADVGGESGEVPGAEIMMSPTDPGKVTITYNPDVRRLQTELRHQNHPLQLIVEYEVDRGAAGAGEVQLLEGYFVHFTAPENLTPIPKHVVFVLDTSGSMRHRKMHQTIAAMVTILGDMRPEDSLTIVSFATEVRVWEGGSVVAASEDNIARAVRYVETLEARGETNINGALLRALDILQEVRDSGARREVQPMVFFLTDGHPTVGETDTLAILDNIKTANSNIGAPIFSLAFGRRTDFQMLRLLSVQNHGFARKIYTAADASLQMAGFYKEVSSPILSNVTFDYLSSDIIHDSLTETAFHTFYQGGEMVVAGMVDVDTHQHAVDTMVMPVFEVTQFTMEYIYHII